MADNLIQKSHKNSDKTKFNNVVHRTTSESLRLSEPEKSMTHPNSLQSSHNPRKISSFQITSVTVGSRVSTDAGEDSADDLDESHTDDISRVTDIENETPSFSEDTFSKDDVFYNASSAPLGCAPVIPTSSQYGLAIVGQDNVSHNQGTAPNANNSDVNDMHVNVTNAASGSIINIIGNAKPQEGMKEINEHVRNERFKVVKIESTEPFRRGRWLCMDYLDHTTTQPNPAIVVNNNIEVTETNTLPAPDSGVVVTDIQIDDITNSMDKTQKDIQLAPTGPPKQMEPSAVKQYAGASPGQSLTQPMNIAQQQIVPPQGVSMQSPPMEVPQQIPQQSMQNTQQVAQPHPQSMTHLTLQNAPNNHAPPPQSQNVQQIPQSFPQHQLQQVIAQTQGMTMQQMPMHQQMPQQMQQIPNQAQIQQMNTQHLTQAQMPAMQQMSQQIPQMQAMTNQAQLQQVPAQQMQMPNAQQLHQMQQGQLNNMSTTHHMQNQGGQPPQLQHMASQPQMQTLQTQQIPNHLQQIQMANTQQINQIQPQIHQQMQTQAQAQQQVVTNMHPQMQQQSMGGVQTQFNQAVQQPNPQAMMNQGIPSSQPPMVPAQHNVSQYHPQPTQINQQGQTLPQEVLSSIAGSQQGAPLPPNIQPMPPQQQGSTMPNNLQGMPPQQQGSTMPNNLQGMATQQQGATMPNNLQGMATQQQGASMPNNLQGMATQQQGATMPNNLQGMATQQQGATMPNNLQGMATQQQNAPVHAMAQQGQSLPQGQITMINPQNMTLMDGNQGNLQIPVSDPIYIQSANVGQQMTMAQHIPQAQNMMPQQVSGGVQYMVGTAQGASVNVSMPQVSMSNVPQQQQIHHPQNIPMSIQQTMPVALSAGVHAGVVQSQTNMQPAVGMSYNNVVPVMSQNSVNSGEAGVSGTSSPVVSLPVSSAPYVQNQPVQLDSQNFGSPVNTVVSHVPSNMVNSGLVMPNTDCGATGETVGDGTQGLSTDNGDGKEENQATGNEDESINGLAMALGGSGAGTPGAEQRDQRDQTSRAPSPGPTADRPPNQSASGTSAVAIDNKIEQAMDLVKSHLMFAVREEVEVLKERIAELMDRITQLEVENTYLRAHASQDTLAQLPTVGNKPAALPPAGPPPPVS